MLETGNKTIARGKIEMKRRAIDIALHDALFVPKLHSNILSVSKMMVSESGFTLFRNKSALVKRDFRFAFGAILQDVILFVKFDKR